MNLLTRTAVAALMALVASQAAAQIVLYEREGFRGRSVVIDSDMRNLDRRGLGDRAGSIVVERGRWEVCEQPRFRGRCALLRTGNYPSLRGSGLAWDISSVRRAQEGRRYEFAPQASAGNEYRYRRRASERVQEVPITSVRAIMGPPSQRCWVERQAVPTTDVGTAVASAVIAGILGYEVGAPRQDVQRCQTVQGAPDHYEVTYNFRGSVRRVQMSAPPVGNTIIVNQRGEPRM